MQHDNSLVAEHLLVPHLLLISTPGKLIPVEVLGQFMITGINYTRLSEPSTRSGNSESPNLGAMFSH